MTNGIYLTCMGELFVLTRAAYKRYLKEVASNGYSDLIKHGKRLDANVRSVTDITRAQATIILEGGYCSDLPRLD